MQDSLAVSTREEQFFVSWEVVPHAIWNKAVRGLGPVGSLPLGEQVTSVCFTILEIIQILYMCSYMYIYVHIHVYVRAQIS